MPARALAAMLLCLAALAGCDTPKRFEFTRIQMGVQCRIVVYGTNRASTENAAAAAFAEVARLDAIMSDYRPESEVSRLSHQEIGRHLPISSDLFDILAKAERVSAASDGVFDVTAAPMVDLWRKARRDRCLPDAGAVDRAMQSVHWQFIVLHAGDRSVSLLRPGVKIDLGGIAKGYAAQHAVEVLCALKHPQCLVALSGDIVVGHAPPGTPGWTITTPGGERLVVSDCGVSTSGDDRQHIEINGVRYSHIIDTRTGLGAIAPRPSCTVIAERGEWADALSTAGYLVGPEGWAKLEREFPGSRAVWGNASR